MNLCYLGNCPGAAQWQMGLHVWPEGADKDAVEPDLIALAFVCCEQHRLDPPDAATLLPEQAQGIFQLNRAGRDLEPLDFSSANVVFKQYLTNGGEWHR